MKGREEILKYFKDVGYKLSRKKTIKEKTGLKLSTISRNLHDMRRKKTAYLWKRKYWGIK